MFVTEGPMVDEVFEIVNWTSLPPVFTHTRCWSFRGLFLDYDPSLYVVITMEYPPCPRLRGPMPLIVIGPIVIRTHIFTIVPGS